MVGPQSRVRKGGRGLFQSWQGEAQGNSRERNRQSGGRVPRPLPRAERRQNGRRAGLSPRPTGFLMSDIVLEIKALTRRFGAFTAVDALTLSVNAGEVFGLLGSNGAGKTTDRKSTRLNSNHLGISYAVFCLKKKKKKT